MRQPREVKCHDRVDRPYEAVRAILYRDTLQLLQRATSLAAGRTSSLIANLHVDVQGMAIGVDVRVLVRRIRDQKRLPGDVPVTRVELTWEAARAAPLFPAMLAEIWAFPVAPGETNIQLEGTYWPPLDRLGDAIDTAIGHRIAEAAVQQLVADLVKQIRDELS